MAQLSERERAELRERLRTDTPFWAQHCAKILNKSRQLVPAVPFPWQLELDAKLEAQRAAGLPMRAIILKARKLGFSTWVALKFLQRLTQRPYQAAIVVAQDVKTAGVIFDMAKLAHAHLPTEADLGLGFSIRPPIIGANFAAMGRKYMTFGEASRIKRSMGATGESVLEIDTANTPESGRGYTPTMLHLSEVARWPESATSGPKSKLLAVLNAVAYVPETIIVLESTANGDNFFQKRWNDAVNGQADVLSGEVYAPLFVPWHRDPASTMQFATAEDRERFIESIGNTREFGEMAEDEPMLVELYDCTPEQLFWRRMQIRTAHKNNSGADGVELFRQENPANPEEAFITSGRPYFSQILVTKAIRAAETAPEPVRGTLVPGETEERRTRTGTLIVPTSALWVPEAECGPYAQMLEVWEHPITAESQLVLPTEERQPEGAYVEAVDVAEGKQDTFTEADFHAISVWDHRTRMQVAQWESRIDRHLVAYWALLVALYYNRAWLAVEVNSVGVAVNDPLAKDYRYPRLYRRRRGGDHRQVKVEERVGWKTDPATKPLVENAMGAVLEADIRGGIRSARMARQLNTYVKDEKGRRGALPGNHDDLLMTAMIAQRVMDELAPPKARGRGPARVVDDPLTGY